MTVALHHSSKVHTLGWEVQELGVQPIAGTVCQVRSIMDRDIALYLYSCAILQDRHCLHCMLSLISNVHKFHNVIAS